MENAGKALTYGVSALLFVLALSVAMLSYTSIINFVDSILTTSERHDHDIEGTKTSYNVMLDDKYFV